MEINVEYVKTLNSVKSLKRLLKVSRKKSTGSKNNDTQIEDLKEVGKYQSSGENSPLYSKRSKEEKGKVFYRTLLK